jgi:hypothetical protein
MRFLSKIEATDTMQFIGLVLFGAGLFFVFGHGWALTAVGIVFILLGFFGKK